MDYTNAGKRTRIAEVFFNTFIWNEEMPDVLDLKYQRYMVSLKTNQYARVNERGSVWSDFGDYIHSQGNHFKYYQINTSLSGTGVALFELGIMN